MKKILFSSFVFGILVSLFGYFWGANNHISHIPIILRILNPKFLPDDFYLNSAFYSHQRFYYAQVVAFFAKFFGLKNSFFFLTFFTNFLNIFLISLLTFKISNSKKAAIIASFLASQPLIEIGGATFLTLNYLIPHLIAVTFSIFALYFGFFKNYYLSLIFFIFSSLIHPQLGIQTGFLCFFCWFLTDFFHKKEKIEKIFKQNLTVLVIFLLFAFLFSKTLKIGNNLLTDKELIFINIYFRNPHHHLFFTIDKITWLITFSFLTTIFLIIFELKKEKKLANFLFFCFWLIIGVLLAVIFGFIFTEVYPVKIIAFSQTLRLFYLLKLIGIVLIASYVTKVNEASFNFLISLFSPLAIFIYFIFKFLRKIFTLIYKDFDIFYYLLIFFVIFWLNDIGRISRASFIFLGILFSLFFSKEKHFFYLNFSILFLLIFFLIKPPPKFIFQTWLKPYKPQFDITFTHKEMPYLAEFAKNHTFKEAVFLTPADFGQFRFLAERSLVVDFKTFVFNEKMKEWYQRIVDIYGKPKNFYYYFLVEELNKNFEKITDEKILFLRKKYNFDYAILYQRTNTNFPVIYSFGNYKIIEVKK